MQQPERLHFSSEMPLDEIFGMLESSRGAGYLDVHCPNPLFPEWNLIAASRKNKTYKSLLSALANKGYYLYRYGQKTSRFVHHKEVRKVWTGYEVGELLADRNGIHFFIEKPEIKPGRKLVVALSSVSGRPTQSSLDRYFEVNFSSLKKYLSPSAAVLRIADLGSVVGAFYLNTKFLSENELQIQGLIERVRTDMGLSREDVVLYGVSKGATGALYHATQMGYSAVCVDPILSDSYYWEKYDDLHFTKETFPKTKEEIFSSLPAPGLGTIAIITSEKSPQYETNRRYVVDRPTIGLINSVHPDINDHPAVSGKTMSATVMLLNMALYGIPLHQNELTII